MLKYHFIMMHDPDDDEGAWMCQEEKTCKFNVKDNFAKLSVQLATSGTPGAIDTGYSTFSIIPNNTALKAEYDAFLNQQRSSSSGRNGGTNGGADGAKRLRLVVTGGGGGGGGMNSGGGGSGDGLVSHNGILMMDKITNHSELTMAVEIMLNMLEPKEYEIRETHYYTMALPQQYYNPYDKWLRVGLALHNTSDKLFVTWMLFRWSHPSIDYVLGKKRLYRRIYAHS